MCSKQSNNPIMNLNETLINLATLLTKLARADDLLGFSKGVYHIERYECISRIGASIIICLINLLRPICLGGIDG